MIVFESGYLSPLRSSTDRKKMNSISKTRAILI